ncbi:MAG TPA: CPBP family intramembrane glutamic endopeptidase [Patescibacteria group bacterium]|nr:CPBP family intramembrane glutamic endopeptidase [Patescibacteria group bacterium]
MEAQPAPTPRLYSPAASILITVFVYFAAQIIAGLGIALVPAVRHQAAGQVENLINNNVWATFGYILVTETLTLWMIHAFIKRRHITFRTLGLNKFQLKYLGYALTGFVVYFALYIVGLAIVKQLAPGLNLEQKQELGFNTSTTGGASLWPVFISLVILPPLTEEIVVRGFLFGGLRTKLNFANAAVIASALFAAAHLGEGGSAGPLWIAAVDTFILSLVLCYLREKTRSLWPSIGVHMIKNGLAFMVLFNVLGNIR